MLRQRPNLAPGGVLSTQKKCFFVIKAQEVKIVKRSNSLWCFACGYIWHCYLKITFRFLIIALIFTLLIKSTTPRYWWSISTWSVISALLHRKLVLCTCCKVHAFQPFHHDENIWSHHDENIYDLIQSKYVPMWDHIANIPSKVHLWQSPRVVQ